MQTWFDSKSIQMENDSADLESNAKLIWLEIESNTQNWLDSKVSQITFAFDSNSFGLQCKLDLIRSHVQRNFGSYDFESNVKLAWLEIESNQLCILLEPFRFAMQTWFVSTWSQMKLWFSRFRVKCKIDLTRNRVKSRLHLTRTVSICNSKLIWLEIESNEIMIPQISSQTQNSLLPFLLHSLLHSLLLSLVHSLLPSLLPSPLHSLVIFLLPSLLPSLFLGFPLCFPLCFSGVQDLAHVLLLAWN